MDPGGGKQFPSAPGEHGGICLSASLLRNTKSLRRPTFQLDLVILPRYITSVVDLPRTEQLHSPTLFDEVVGEQVSISISFPFSHSLLAAAPGFPELPPQSCNQAKHCTRNSLLVIRLLVKK
ncbi:hypothetical protein PtB15_6B563 [Puccinia triticina]|nr:hypothetical protein PtB15_6B563 [Puccinia triticina]